MTWSSLLKMTGGHLAWNVETIFQTQKHHVWNIKYSFRSESASQPTAGVLHEGDDLPDAWHRIEWRVRVEFVEFFESVQRKHVSAMCKCHKCHKCHNMCERTREKKHYVVYKKILHSIFIISDPSTQNFVIGKWQQGPWVHPESYLLVKFQLLQAKVLHILLPPQPLMSSNQHNCHVFLWVGKCIQHYAMQCEWRNMHDLCSQTEPYTTSKISAKSSSEVEFEWYGAGYEEKFATPCHSSTAQDKQGSGHLSVLQWYTIFTGSAYIMKNKNILQECYSIQMAWTARGIQVWQSSLQEAVPNIGQWWSCRNSFSSSHDIWLIWHSSFQLPGLRGNKTWNESTTKLSKFTPLENLRGGSARHVAETLIFEALSWKKAEALPKKKGQSMVFFSRESDESQSMCFIVSLRVWNFEGWIVDSERYWYCLQFHVAFW